MPKKSAIRLFIALFFLLSIVISTGCAGNTKKLGLDMKSGTVVRSEPGSEPSNSEPINSEVNNSEESNSNMKLASSAFEDNQVIPAKYARQGIAGGQNISPPLEWDSVPPDTKSFALAMVDVSARNWVHWMVINIPPETRSIGEGASGSAMPAGSKELLNTFGTSGYGGPQPPAGTGVHYYVTTLYALSVEGLDLPESASYSDFLKAIDGKVLAKASLTGGFSGK